MQKAWIYQRKNRPGYWVGWYVNGRRKAKILPNKSVAKRFARRLEHELNEGIYFEPIPTPWDKLVAEYIEHKEAVQSLGPESVRSIKVTLEHFKKLNGPVLSTRIDQRLIDRFVAQRLRSASKPTVNKDLRNLRAFIRWSIKHRYMGAQAAKLEWIMQKEAKRPVRALNKAQLNDLLVAARKHSYAWYIRVLLAASSGLRRGDIERLQFSDIDFQAGTLSTFSQKTGKGMANRPLHPKVATELAKFLESVPEGQIGLFTDKFTSGKWEKIRKAAGLRELKFHDLRRTFASFVAQAGFSTSVTQDLLEHSTPRLTHEVYTDVQPVYRKAIESIPIDDITTP